MAYFAYSFDNGDFYNGEYMTEEEAFNAAVQDEHSTIDHMAFLLSSFSAAPLKWNTTAEDIISEIEENFNDSAGSFSFAELCVTDKQRTDLDNRLEECIRSWIKANRISSPLDLIHWTKRFICNEFGIYEEDLDYEA